MTRALILLLIGGVGIFAYNGLSSRYLADDVCILVEIDGQDLVTQTAAWYGDASGRIAQFVTLIAAFRLGAAFAMISPALLILLLVLALWWSLRPLAAGAALPLALAVVFAGLAASPQIEQSLYWVTGAYTYAAPLILLALMPGIILRARRAPIPAGIALFALALIAGTFAEPVATLQAAALALALASAFLRPTGTPLRWTLAAGCAGALAALALLLLSPGNALRSTDFTPSPSIFGTAGSSVAYALVLIIGTLARFAPGTMLCAFGLGLLTPLLSPLPDAPSGGAARKLLVWLVAAILIVSAFMAPGFHATSAPPPARSFVVALLFMAGWYAALGIGVGLWLRPRLRPDWRRFTPAAALALTLIGVVPVALQSLRLTPLYRQHAAEWDAHDQTLRAAPPGSDVTLPAFTVDVAANLGLETLTADPGNPFNRCVAAYYGVNSVAVLPAGT